jgi:hypothetical protein
MVRCRDLEHLNIINYALLIGCMSGGIWWALRLVESSAYAYISENVSRLSYKISSLLSHPNRFETDGLFEKPHV